MTTVTPEAPKFALKDFTSDQDVRWCPGCGDYSILSSVRKVLASRHRRPEDYCFISGIGCSSRFPYYMDTYGMHTIHGRAAAVATGFKIQRPDIETWVVSGDGDSLSIGGNHTIHLFRRNVNVKLLLFNNKIYGLTKGQYSPTSELNKKTKSSPMGSCDEPLSPLCMALAAGATFVARGVDMHQKHLIEVIERAADHKGTAFVEIYQNCNIFNDGAFEYAQDRKVRADNVVELRHGEPLVFGANLDKGIVRRNGRLAVVTIGQDGITREDLVVHDEQAPETVAYELARLRHPEFPEPIGVLRAVQRPSYDDMVNDQIATAVKKQGRGELQELLKGPETWVID